MVARSTRLSRQGIPCARVGFVHCLVDRVGCHIYLLMNHVLRFEDEVDEACRQTCAIKLML